MYLSMKKWTTVILKGQVAIFHRGFPLPKKKVVGNFFFFRIFTPTKPEPTKWEPTLDPQKTTWTYILEGVPGTNLLDGLWMTPGTGKNTNQLQGFYISHSWQELQPLKIILAMF